MSNKSAMKKKLEHEEMPDCEVLKAVAQAWQGRSTTSRHTNEFDAHRQNHQARPSRFMLEAISKPANDGGGTNWDFARSLWDSYELVTLSKKLETGLVFDHPMSGAQDLIRAGKRRRESKNSLRSLFYRVSSKRIDVDIPLEEDGDPKF